MLLLGVDHVFVIGADQHLVQSIHSISSYIFFCFLIFKIATAQPHDYVLQQPCVTPKIYIHTYIPISQCVHIYVQHKIDSVLMLQRRGKDVWTNVGNATAIIIIFFLVLSF